MNEAETRGTEAATPAGAASPEPTPAPTTEQLQAALAELQSKYDGQLDRLTGLEEAKNERDRLRALVDSRIETHRSTSDDPDQQIADRFRRFEAKLQHALDFGTEDEKDAAAAMLGMFGHVRALPERFNDRLEEAMTPAEIRAEVQAIQKEAAASGNRISASFARTILEQRRELATFKAKPQPTPVHTSVRPSSEPVTTTTNVPAGEMTPEQRRADYKAFREGRDHLRG